MVTGLSLSSCTNSMGICITSMLFFCIQSQSALRLCGRWIMNNSEVISANKKPKGGGWHWPTFWQVQADEAKDVTPRNQQPAALPSVTIPDGVKEMVDAHCKRKWGKDFKLGKYSEVATDCEYIGAWLAIANESEFFYPWYRENTIYRSRDMLLRSGVKCVAKVLTDFYAALPSLQRAKSARRSAKMQRIARHAKRSHRIHQ